jgi:uncharacterized protein YbjT (DUF2867 family)
VTIRIRCGARTRIVREVRVLVTGATGYIGGRLVPRLLEAGHEVRCLSRSPEKLRGVPWADRVEVARGDLGDPASLPAAFAGVDVAYFLVHSLGRPDFEALDRANAEAFARAARDAGVGRIVYLGGPEPPAGSRGSAHLRSRAEVARILLESGTPTAVLRAPVIIGSGSASFEMLRYLTERLPAMVTPRWVRNRIQPIAVRDVLHYLVAAATLPAGVNRGFDIAGPDVLTFTEMMRRYAAVAGLPRRLIVPVRPLTPKLSSLWVGFVTPVPNAIARPLVGSLIHEAVAHEHDIAAYVPDPPGGLTGFDRAVELARTKVRDVDGQTRWSRAGSPAEPLPTDPDWSGGSVHTDLRERPVAADAGTLWRAIERVGGARGWRVEELVPGDLLRLRATPRLPGRAWLEMRAVPDGPARSTYRQRAVFLPHGLAGHACWAATRPFHGLIFRRLARTVTRAAERPGSPAGS